MKNAGKKLTSFLLAIILLFTGMLSVACSDSGKQKTGLGYDVNRENMFGICALPSDLFTPSADAGVTTDQISSLIKVMNIKSVRVWMHIPYVLERAKKSNELSVKKVAAAKYHDYFAKLSDAGVENILVMSHRYLYPVEMVEPQFNGVVPEPDTDEYICFMNLFEDCYRVMSKEFPEITLWEPNNEMDYSKGSTVVRYGYTAGASAAQNAAYLYDTDEVAGITADMCYYANRGIKENNPNNELVMPGLCFTPDSSGTIFLETLYEQIASGNHPTSFDEDGNRVLPADKNTDNYFNVLNWHPYPNNAPSDAWINANVELYNVAVQFGDAGKKIFLSEFGWYDDFSETRQNNIGTWCVQAFDMLKEKLPSLEAVFIFRMFNWVSTTEDVKDMEKTFGIFTSPEEEGGIQPKPIAISLYKYFNGENADLNKLYSAVQAA